MKKAIIFITDTGDTKVIEMVKEAMHGYCMDKGYEVVVSVKDAGSVQMSSMMKYAVIGIAMEHNVEVVVTFIPEMISKDEQSLVDTLRVFCNYNIEVETFTGNMEEYYRKAYPELCRQDKNFDELHRIVSNMLN